MIHRRLTAFISSVARLTEERRAIEGALESLQIDGSRFEAWPSSPNKPIEECLRRVEDSDAFVLLLGQYYGTELQDGLSATHKEYHHARHNEKPIFVFVMENNATESKQRAFIQEVESNSFRCKRIRTIAELGKQVADSFLQEFTRSFRGLHAPPRMAILRPKPSIPDSTASLPTSIAAARSLLGAMYERGDDAGIHDLAEACELEFADDPEILAFVFASEVSLGINGGGIDHNRVARAIEVWNRVLREGSDHSAAIRYNLGNAFAVLRRYDLAVEHYNAALDEQPDMAEGWKNLGAAHVERGDRFQARRCLEQAVTIEPRLPQALYSLAILTFQEGGSSDVALSWMNRIATTQIPPATAAGVHGWKAVLFGSLGRYAEAIASAEDALSLDPGAQWAWMGAARLYSLARSQSSAWLADAISFWRRFLEKHSHLSEAWGELGHTLWLMGDQTVDRRLWGEALLAFERAIELGFTDGGLLEDRVGHIYQADENWPDAERFFRRAAAKNEAQFGYCLGVSLIILGQYAEALPLVQRAAEKYLPGASSWFQVARCHEGLGSFTEAIKAYETVLEFDESHADAWFNLGGSLWNGGDRARAFEVWQNASRRFSGHRRSAELVEFIALSLVADKLAEGTEMP